MRSSEFDAGMRLFEAASDRVTAPGNYVVVRLCGRSFARLLRGRHDIDRPLDVRVRDILIATADHLMNCGLPVVFGYTQSDEITLLLGAGGPGVAVASATLAGEASGKCTLLFGALASFAARAAELDGLDQVVDYFLWRQAAAARAAVRAHCAWGLQQCGASEADARGRVEAATEDELVALQAELEVDVAALPSWQSRGVGLGWERPETTLNLRTGAPVGLSRRIRVLLELPMGEGYAALVRAQARQAATPAA